jgi:GntR family transcriptional regulator of vanillate catabolism
MPHHPVRFHELILFGAQSEVLKRMMEQILCMPFAAPSALVTGPATQRQGIKWLGIAHHQHHALVDAIEKGQSGRAQAIAEEHVNIPRENLRYILDKPEIARKLIPGIRLNQPTSKQPLAPGRRAGRTRLIKRSE